MITSAIFGSDKELTSFTISAPKSRAAFATAARLVSIEIPTLGNAVLTALITGKTRFISSSMPTGSAPGLVDSPPISSQSAPSSTICLARDKASSTESTLESA